MVVVHGLLDECVHPRGAEDARETDIACQVIITSKSSRYGGKLNGVRYSKRNAVVDNLHSLLSLMKTVDGRNLCLDCVNDLSL